MRVIVRLVPFFLVAACASQGNPDSESSNFESRIITTASNMSRKSTGAVDVDRSVLQDPIDRQGTGGPQR